MFTTASASATREPAPRAVASASCSAASSWRGRLSASSAADSAIFARTMPKALPAAFAWR